VYDFDKEALGEKVRFFCDLFNAERERWKRSDRKTTLGDFVDRTIKWTSELEAHLVRGTALTYDDRYVTSSSYRPFVKQYFYYDRVVVHRPYQQPDIFPIAGASENQVICFTNPGSPKPFAALASQHIPDLHFTGDTQCLPLYRYTAAGDRVDNITDWALAQFQARYPDHAARITPQAIFHYVYAVLHHPAYRAKYERNLKRELPRIPFYDDFWQWAAWGEQLMALHLDYEQVAPYPLAREDKDLSGFAKRPRDGEEEGGNLTGLTPTPRLIARKEAGVIEVDTITTLRGVPAEAWEYRLGTYSALEWILERYKERTPKDPTIRDKFNTYRFADYKEPVIDLLRRVCTVSVETMKIVRQMPK
jgi:predicted helicase